MPDCTTVRSDPVSEVQYYWRTHIQLKLFLELFTRVWFRYLCHSDYVTSHVSKGVPFSRVRRSEERMCLKARLPKYECSGLTLIPPYVHTKSLRSYRGQTLDLSSINEGKMS